MFLFLSLYLWHGVFQGPSLLARWEGRRVGKGYRGYYLFECRFASIAKIAGEQLQPYVAQLVPKLYR